MLYIKRRVQKKNGCNMGKIKNVVFDFGGILIDLDQKASFDAFGKLLDMEHITQDNIHELVGSALIDLEKGNISNEAFIWKFQHIKGGNVDPVKIIKAWNAMLLGIRPEIFEFLIDVKSRYQSALLSNTNDIHIRHVVYRELELKHDIRNWSAYFHHVFYSHEMHMRKPDHEIYDELIRRTGYVPNETLFIDDNIENVLAAIECGWHAVQHDPKEKIEVKLQSYIDACESI